LTLTAAVFERVVDPFKVTVWVPALSVMVRVPVTAVSVVGVKVTLIVQFALAARLAGQLLVWAKGALVETLTLVIALVPAFVRVTGCDALVVPTATPENVRLLVEREAPEAVPVKVTVCGLPLALSVMVRVPLTVPGAVGVNVTLIAQEAPAAMPVPQVLVWEKPLLVVILEKVREAVPASVTVID
jgi:hypothetical protein